MSLEYAKGTTVSVQKSRVEIEQLLAKWKATRTATMVERDRAAVYFQMGVWHVQFTIPLPTEAEAAKLKDGRSSWKTATKEQQSRWLEQKQRERWRALLLAIKAKLISVENGVETFEEAFLAHLVLPSGQTVGQTALPAVAEAVKTGKTPSMLLGPGAQP